LHFFGFVLVQRPLRLHDGCDSGGSVLAVGLAAVLAAVLANFFAAV
jgi:hypothetical protein